MKILNKMPEEEKEPKSVPKTYQKNSRRKINPII
jgi:hypothetical protein